ncbi:MAG: toast rack family protein [Candidatus Acidiferrales bacterium]
MKLRDAIEITPKALVSLIFAVTLGLSGCIVGSGHGPLAKTGEMQTENVSIPLSAAKSVDVHLQMSAGEINISGGSPQLLDGTIKYNVPDWKPDVSYSVNDGKGALMVMQPEASHTTIGGVKYTWDLHLNNAVPLDVAVEMGAGNSTLNFSSLTLRNLDVQMGAGNSIVDLTGDWKQNVTASIQGGVGEAHIKLPRDTGVRVTVDGGLGSVNAPDFKKDGDSYVNDAYGKSKVTVEVHVTGGIGEVYLELSGTRPIV